VAPLPDFTDFAQRYAAGKAQVVWTSLVADLETPVSAMLKLAEGRPYSFLLESVTGGEIRGRYSLIGMKPDLVWRCYGDRVEINRDARCDLKSFQPLPGKPLDELRNLIAESRIELADELPPMAAGLFGFMTYDMVRQMERLPDNNPDSLELPDSIYVRPTVMAIFDSVKDEVTVVTPVYPRGDLTAGAAHSRALDRISSIVDSLDQPLGHSVHSDSPTLTFDAPDSNTTPDEYKAMVERAKEYIAAGDIFQTVISQRFQAPFPLSPFALYPTKTTALTWRKPKRPSARPPWHSGNSRC